MNSKFTFFDLQPIETVIHDRSSRHFFSAEKKEKMHKQKRDKDTRAQKEEVERDNYEQKL